MSGPEKPCLYCEPNVARDAVSQRPDVPALDTPVGPTHSAAGRPTACEAASEPRLRARLRYDAPFIPMVAESLTRSVSCFAEDGERDVIDARQRDKSSCIIRRITGLEVLP